MGLMKEFKEFAVKGNVVDMAVGVVIGGAFGKIVTSLVNDVLMPPIGKAIGGVNFSELKYVLSEAVTEAGEVVQPEAAIYYGQFIQTILDFIIIAFAIFMMVKGINRLKKKEADAPAPKADDVVLLEEIRDLLKKQA